MVMAHRGNLSDNLLVNRSVGRGGRVRPMSIALRHFVPTVDVSLRKAAGDQVLHLISCAESLWECCLDCSKPSGPAQQQASMLAARKASAKSYRHAHSELLSSFGMLDTKLCSTLLCSFNTCYFIAEGILLQNRRSST